MTSNNLLNNFINLHETKKEPKSNIDDIETYIIL